MKFVLERIDEATGCLDTGTAFEVENIERLCFVLGESAENIQPGWSALLDSEQLKNLRANFDMGSLFDADQANLRTWMRIDELPYKVHTNRELILMLSGKKPLAVFSEVVPDDIEFELIPEKYFAKYVECGRFVKREAFWPLEEKTVRTVFYAVPEQSWRIDAYLLMKKVADKAGWSEGFERMEGTLLGYEDWQNDIYIEKFFKKK